MIRRSRLPRRIILTLSIAAVLFGPPGIAAYAQSPSPNVEFKDFAPGSSPGGVNGFIVEGLGMLNCSYSLSSVEQQTVADINSGHATITEISPQNNCIPDGGQHIGAYESAINSLVSYVEAHASRASTLWGGIMLDEEPNFGLDTLHVYALNDWLYNKMLGVPGISFWYAEPGNWSGGWTQAQYADVFHDNGTDGYNYSSIPAPQVYNSFQASEQNALGYTNQMVTWWAGASYPWDGESGTVSYASTQISGAPYNQQFGTTHTFEWQNQFQ